MSANWVEIATDTAELARKAGQLILRLTPEKREVQYKGERDMVTEVDRAVEDLILNTLGQRYPKHQLVAEESSVEHTPSADFVWYIDPLDGTTNYVHGFPAYCVSLGLSHLGNLVVGMIYDPLRDELFTATRGGGAFLNETSIQVSSTPDLKHSLLATGFPYLNDAFMDTNMRLWQQVYGKTQGLRRAGAAALDLAYVAAGRLDGYWEFSLHPWDQAAGVLLVEEAGGRVTQMNGADFDINCRNLLATNTHLHELLLKEFDSHMAALNL